MKLFASGLLPIASRVAARVALGALVAVVSLDGVAACSSSSSTPPSDPVTAVSTATSGLGAFVDPFIGTGDGQSPDPVGNGLSGATFPGAAAPFGMVQFSPDTPNPSPPGYHYADDTVSGFSLTHLNGAGCPSLRDIPIFPAVARPDFSTEPTTTFSHADEKASPGFYEVKLASNVLVDLTATQRSGLARFTFPQGSDAHVVLSGGRRNDVFNFSLSGFEAHLVGNDTVTGFRDGGRFCLTDSKYRIYYAVRFDRPFAGFGTVESGEATDGRRDVTIATGSAFFRFSTSPSRVVHMKIGLSYVSVEHAIANMDAENPGWDFDAVHQKTLDDWNARLGKVQIEGTDDTARKALYTGIYHALIQPAVFSDADGSYIGFDGKVKVDAVHPRYANFSGWDVYRSWIHLLALLAPKETSDFVRSLIGAGQECGALPRWSLANDDSGMMVGDPSSPTIAGAYAFGARDFDAAAALALMVKNGSDPSAKCNAAVARPGLADYLQHGFYSGVGSSNAVDGHASMTMEYAVADYAVAQMAKAVGDEATHTTFLARSGNWRNVFDVNAAGGPLPQARNADDVGGAPSFIASDSAANAGFTEGNPAQYTFFVPQDPYGLFKLLGGDAATISRLDALFVELNAGVTRPHFYMGNEPQFATPWLYAFAGAADKTQAIVRKILTSVYSTQPGGLPGNDDLGATSAWQVWALLGLYPAVPGSGTLVIGSPWFPKTTITLGSGKTLTMTAAGASQGAPYVQSLKVGGQNVTRSYVTWDEIKDGQTLDFVLGTAPNAAFGSALADRPPTL
ncbi:MAG: alpha,2-mannosidase [Myxococcaceae bacterium]|nr:alpha,2-mannosidase [Myxococcaceae bacterium]